MTEPIVGHAYEIHSRNLEVAVYVGHRAFVGIREKFDHHYLFTEFGGDGTGTVRSVGRDLGPVPEGIVLYDHLEARCSVCGRLTSWLPDGSTPTPGRSIHEDGTELEDGAGTVCGDNRPLFDFLANIEKELGL